MEEQITDRVSLIPVGNRNRPMYRLRGGSPTFITLHETANERIGANAEMHRIFTHNGGGKESVSFHAVVDQDETIQLLPWNEVGWHAGDNLGDGNFDSIGIELCINKDGDFTRTRHNAARLVARLMFEFDIPIERVVQHNHWSGKDCPQKMRHTPALWQETIAYTQAEYAAIVLGHYPPSPPSAWPQIDPDAHVEGGFAVLYAQEGVVRCGLPLSNEYKERVLVGNNLREVTFQDFENVVFEWYPGIQPRIGAGVRKYKYGR